MTNASTNIYIINSILWGGTSEDLTISGTSTVDLQYSDIEVITGTYGALGLISMDPLFVNAGANNYHLSAGPPWADIGVFEL